MHAVRQVTTLGQAHAHDGVAWLQQGQKYRLVGLRTRVCLHIDVIRSVELLESINTQLLDHVDKLTSTVVTLARVTFSVFVGQNGALHPHDSRAGVVFRRNQLNVLLLTLRLLQHR